MTVTIWPIRDVAAFDATLAAARADGHDPMVPPTHAVRSPAGEIVGAFNIGPVVAWWMRADQRMRDSLAAFAAMETLQRNSGVGRYAILISEESPYGRVVETAGLQYVEGLRVLTKGT